MSIFIGKDDSGTTKFHLTKNVRSRAELLASDAYPDTIVSSGRLFMSVTSYKVSPPLTVGGGYLAPFNYSGYNSIPLITSVSDLYNYVFSIKLANGNTVPALFFDQPEYGTYSIQPYTLSDLRNVQEVTFYRVLSNIIDSSGIVSVNRSSFTIGSTDVLSLNTGFFTFTEAVATSALAANPYGEVNKLGFVTSSGLKNVYFYSNTTYNTTVVGDSLAITPNSLIIKKGSAVLFNSDYNYPVRNESFSVISKSFSGTIRADNKRLCVFNPGTLPLVSSTTILVVIKRLTIVRNINRGNPYTYNFYNVLFPIFSDSPYIIYSTFYSVGFEIRFDLNTNTLSLRLQQFDYPGSWIYDYGAVITINGYYVL